MKSKFICAYQVLLDINDPDKCFIDKSLNDIEYYHLETENHNIIKISGIHSETLNNIPNRKNRFSEIK